jgi:YHS domain-containing protein
MPHKWARRFASCAYGFVWQLAEQGGVVAQNGAMESNCVFKDPVCGMTVTDKSFHHLERQGQSYFFCGTKCKTRFANQMDRYAGQNPAQIPQQENATSRWTPGRLLSAGLLLMALVSLALWLI